MRAALAAAEQAFRDGRFQETIDALQLVGDAHPASARARFLEAYAHYKLGQLERAEQSIARVTETTAETTLLRGMIAFRREAWDTALIHLRAAASGEDPWAGTARRLIEKVLATQAAARREAEARARAAEQARRAALFKTSVAEAKRLIERGRHAPARVALDRAEKARPGQAVVVYYRGYSAYAQKRYATARRLFERALRIDGHDGWSRYMLALSLNEIGKERRAQRLLGRLAARDDDAGVRRAAERALVRMRVVPEKRAGGPEVRLEAGTGVDSNPAYLEESSALQQDALALLVGARLGYAHRFSSHLEGSIGGRFTERAYVLNGEGAAHTDVGGWMSWSLLGSAVALSATYDYALALYGHDPLLSSHTGELALKIGRSRFSGILAGLGGARVVHDPDYRYLAAQRAGGELRGRYANQWLTLELGYGLVREWADTVETQDPEERWGSKQQTPPGQGRGGPAVPAGSQPATVDYTDYSLIEHGPSLWSELSLPWRLIVRAGAGLSWRRFDGNDTVTNIETGITTTLPARRDLRLVVDAELARSFPLGFELAARFETLENFSTAEQTAEGGIDRDYSRRVGELVLRWVWPAR